MNETAIEFQHVHKTYGSEVIIDDLSFTVEHGDFITLIGSSGCGKTTTLKMINALIKPTSGNIFVEGQSVCEQDPVQLRRSIGYVIQGGVLFPHMSVEKNIAYVPSLLNRNDHRRTSLAVEKWMDIVGLDKSLCNRYPDELSGGQRQRVGIARALAASPEILLMDEPFSAVDEITRQSLQDEMARIHRETNITVVFVTHDIREALKLATKVMVMDRGAIQQYDKPGIITQHPSNSFVKQLVHVSRFDNWVL